MQRFKTKTTDYVQIGFIVVYASAAIVLILDLFFWR